MLKIEMKQSVNTLFKKHEEIGLKEHEDTKAFIEYSNNMQNVHTNIEEYNPNRKRKE